MAITKSIMEIFKNTNNTDSLPALLAQKPPSFAGVLEVVHSIPGRIRVKIPSTKGVPVLSDNIVKAMSPVRGVKKISANALLGTFLIEYDSAVLSPTIVVSALTYCFNFEGEMRARKSILAKELSTVGFALNQALLSRTKGILDIRAAITLLLVFQLVKSIPIVRRKLGLQASPTYFPINLIWWLFQSVSHSR